MSAAAAIAADAIPVWNYDYSNGDTPQIYRLGDTMIPVILHRNGKSAVVRNLPLPHDKEAVQKILDLPPEKQHILRPGMKVALKIDPQFKKSKKEIEAHFTKLLKENGVEVTATAATTISVAVNLSYETALYNKDTGKRIIHDEDTDAETIAKDTRAAYSVTRVREFQITVSVERDQISGWYVQRMERWNPIEDSPFIIPQNDQILDFDDSPVTRQENVADEIFARVADGKQPYKKLLFDLQLPKQVSDPSLYGVSVMAPDGTILSQKNPYLRDREQQKR